MKRKTPFALLPWIAVVTGSESGTAGDRDVPAPPAVLLSSGRLEASQVRHVEALLKQFQDPDPDRRRAAAIAVGRVGDAAIPLIRERIEGTSNALVQRTALLALDAIGGEAAAATIRLAVADGRLRDEELAVAWLVLGRLAPPEGAAAGEVLEALTEAATSRKASVGRRAALLAAGRRGDSDTIRTVIGTASREPLDDVKIAILTAAAALADASLAESVVAMLTDRSDGVRRAACLAIAESGDSRGIDSLLRIVKADRSEPVIAAAALALGRQVDSASRDALAALAQHRDEAVRAAAWAALASRNDAVSQVTEVLTEGKDPDVVARVALACAASRSPQLEQPLESLLTHSRAEVRAAAGLALAARGSRAAESRLAAWLRTEKDAAARADALLVAGVLALPAAREVIATVASGSLSDLAQQVRRTIEGRRDPRLLAVALDARLRALRARESDLRTEEFAALVASVFHFDSLNRLKPTGKPPPGSSPGGGDGGGGDGQGGGEGGGDGAGGGGSPYLHAKVDRRNSAVERDLETWFRTEPYFRARDPLR